MNIISVCLTLQGLQHNSIQYIYDSQRLQFFKYLEDTINLNRDFLPENMFAQHMKWLRTFRSFINAQFKVVRHLTVIVNYGDQAHYTLTMKKFTDAGILDDGQYGDMTAKINKSWAYTASIQEIMRSVPKYKGKFDSLLTEKYYGDYCTVLNEIVYKLRELDPETQGKSIDKLLQKKGLSLGNATLEHQIAEAASKIKNLISVFSDKSYEFDSEFAWMDFNYYQRANEPEKRKKLILATYPTFVKKFDDFLKLVDDKAEAMKKELEKLCKEVLPPVLEILYNELHNLPSDLNKAMAKKTSAKK